MSNLKVPLQLDEFIPCAAAGAGELVTLSGSLHILATVVINANHVHMTLQDQPAGVRGIGQTTGDKYQGTGVTRQDFNASTLAFPLVFTYVNNFRIIGAGRANNLLIHEVAQLMINANGVVTVARDLFSEECK